MLAGDVCGDRHPTGFRPVTPSVEILNVYREHREQGAEVPHWVRASPVPSGRASRSSEGPRTSGPSRSLARWLSTRCVPSRPVSPCAARRRACSRGVGDAPRCLATSSLRRVLRECDGCLRRDCAWVQAQSASIASKGRRYLTSRVEHASRSGASSGVSVAVVARRRSGCSATRLGSSTGGSAR